MMMNRIAAPWTQFVMMSLAGIIGCGAQKPIEIPASTFDSVDANVPRGTPRDPDSENAGRDNPRIAKFAEFDTDQDGRLTLQEFTVDRKPKEAEKWFRRRDVDGDGSVSLAEFVPQSPLSTTQPASQGEAESNSDSALNADPPAAQNESLPSGTPTSSEAPAT